MRARVALIVALLAGLSVAVTGCSVIISDGPERARSFDIDYRIGVDGTIHATETIEWDFSDRENPHCIDRTLNSRFFVDESTDRVYEYSNLTVSSPSGASALFSTALDNSLRIRIGNANDTTRGRQTYVVSYDIAGALNTVQQPDGLVVQQLYWNATGLDWSTPLENVTVSVTGPSGATLAQCFAGPAGSTASCDSAVANDTGARWTQRYLGAYQGVTVVADWPVGTFTSTAPILAPSLPLGTPPVLSGSNDGPDPFLSPLNWGVGLAALLGIPLLFWLLVLSRRRDETFIAVTPGEIPAHAATAPTERAPRRQTIVTRLQPPREFSVGAANRVLHKSRRSVDVTAMLIDLAVRGHLRIEEIDGRKGKRARDYRLVATPERAEAKSRIARAGTPAATPLFPHEQLLLDKLFASSHSVTLSSLTNRFAASMRAINIALDLHISKGGYFLDKLGTAHPALGWGIAAGVALFVGALALDLEKFILVPIGLVAGSATAISLSRRAARRSALGHALYLQVAGFRRYIETAEADRIRFDETEDIFSRYMPWAIAFGEADRWAKVFAQLAAEGRMTTTPDWYIGVNSTISGGAFGAVSSISSIGDAVSSFSTAATTSFSSTPSSSGSSGSGGGGSSGGGGGGGGGGGW